MEKYIFEEGKEKSFEIVFGRFLLIIHLKRKTLG